jgi:hypothetical protein
MTPCKKLLRDSSVSKTIQRVEKVVVGPVGGPKELESKTKTLQ